MTNAAAALLTERSFDLRDRPAEILVQLLKSLVQRLELAGTGFVISAIRTCTIDVELFLRRGSEKGIVNGGQGTLNPFFAVGGITHTPTTRYICRLPTLRVSLLIDCSSVGHSMAKAGRNGAAGRAKCDTPVFAQSMASRRAMAAPAYPRNPGRCGVLQSPELKSLIRGPRMTVISRRGHCCRRNLAARRRIGLSSWFKRSSQASSRAWRR